MDTVKFLWASPHQPTSEQVSALQAEGTVIYLSEIDTDLFKRLVNQEFQTDLTELVEEVLKVCSNEQIDFLTQPGGSPAFQFTLGRVIAEGKTPAVRYAFSKRVSEDIPQPDGSVKKVSTFVHEGWVDCK